MVDSPSTPHPKVRVYVGCPRSALWPCRQWCLSGCSVASLGAQNRKKEERKREREREREKKRKKETKEESKNESKTLNDQDTDRTKGRVTEKNNDAYQRRRYSHVIRIYYMVRIFNKVYPPNESFIAVQFINVMSHESV